MMRHPNNRTLGDICDEVGGIIRTGPFGSQLHQSDYKDDGLPVIMPKDIINGKVETESIARIGEADEIRLKEHKLRKGDIVFARRGDLGRCALIGERENGWLCGTGSLRVSVGNTVIDPTYLFYYFSHDNIISWIKSRAIGATLPNLNTSIIRDIPISYPSLPIQRKIADVLSAYDDLIEVNTRRIRILEQMAQSVYREWFGKVEEGALPEGWKIQTMQEVADVIDCLHTKKPSHVENGIGILLQLNNIGENGKLDLTKKFLLSKEDYELWTSRIEASPGDCVVTNVGRVAAVAQIPAGVKAALGRNMTGIRPKFITPTYLIEFLLSPNMEREVNKKKDSGAIMDALNVRGIIRLELVIPPREVLQKFEDIARPMRRRIEILVQQNANLRRTRDLLLPRLVSGDVAVHE